ncbi:unnamed protein product [Bathycoccus prasinos]|tara:strand:- start:705 stop:1640 length:936 start_codon:yes stop_codon:yes gene_type:complete
MTALSSFSSRRRSTFPSSSLSRRNNSKRVRPPKATTKKNEDEDDEDNAETETISLTSNQARIAALAFDVLYNKPFLNEEQMMKDPERPKLRLMLREAIDRAEQLCKEEREEREGGDGSNTNNTNKREGCRAAWEIVDELEDAAMRAGMSRTNRTVESRSGSSSSSSRSESSSASKTKGAQPPRRIPKMSEVGLSEEELKERAMKAKRVDPFEDPLKDLDPCGPLGCEAETGEMNSRGILERAMMIPNKEERSKFDEESDKTLANAISEAVEKAMSLCDEGGDACATAWEVVEELSASANKRRREKREEKEE